MSDHKETLVASCTEHDFALVVTVNTELLPVDPYDATSPKRPAIVPEDGLDGIPDCPWPGCQSVVLNRVGDSV